MGENLKPYLKEYKLLDGSYALLVEKIGDGSIIKRFDVTPYPSKRDDIVCPHYLELKWAIGCPFRCSWCYLWGTLRLQPRHKEPVIKLSVSSRSYDDYVFDYDIHPYTKIERHVRAFFRVPQPVNEVLNTGELADSLMFENVERPFSKFIIPLFEEQKQHKVLFLTKSPNVKNLLEIEKHNQTIISFSLNSLKVAKRWEKAPSPIERINAAKKVFESNYEVRIRIDPIVPWPENSWYDDYKKLIDLIFDNIYPERITLGSLRGLYTTIRYAKDKSWVIFLKEKTKWGLRIPFKKRYETFKKIIEYLENEYNYNRYALCKEPRIMWESLNMNWRECKCNCVW